MLCDRMGYMSVVFGVCESDWTRATRARRRCPRARACLVEWKSLSHLDPHRLTCMVKVLIVRYPVRDICLLHAVGALRG